MKVIQENGMRPFLFVAILASFVVAQERGKFDLMLDYQPLGVSNISAHTGAFLHASPFLPFEPGNPSAGGVRIDFVIGIDHTVYVDDDYAATIFGKMGGFWNEDNASYLVLTGTWDGSQPVHTGFEHQWRFFARRHFACLVNGQIFIPVPATDIEYKAMRFGAVGFQLRVF